MEGFFHDSLFNIFSLQKIFLNSFEMEKIDNCKKYLLQKYQLYSILLHVLLSLEKETLTKKETNSTAKSVVQFLSRDLFQPGGFPLSHRAIQSQRKKMMNEIIFKSNGKYWFRSSSKKYFSQEQLFLREFHKTFFYLLILFEVKNMTG